MKVGVANRFLGSLVVTVALLACGLLTACRQAQPTVDYVTLYSLEVVNDTLDRLRVCIKPGGQIFFEDIPDDAQRSRPWSGIVALESGASRTFTVLSGPGGRRDSQEDNDLVRAFYFVGFYEADSDHLYRSYLYETRGCGGPDCWDSADDTEIFFVRDDGVLEYLFVESADRPFYLARDQEDSDLARIVITFVPSADDAGSRDAMGCGSR